MIRKYKHLFFDIDKTLWDYESNVKEIILDLYNKRNLKALSVDYEKFLTDFKKYNDLLWSKYQKGLINKEILRDRRFYLTLKKSGILNKDLAVHLSNDYLEISPNKTNLFPEVIETLEYLKLHYRLHIITNGFNEVQYKKLKNSGINHFFEKIVTSDSVGSQKPNMKIFEYALTSVNARKKESLMIGDDWEIDILGAKAYGLDQVYFNPGKLKNNGSATFEIYGIGELQEIL
jgi:putative hydrolase of the HAD superfamily